ncbi:crossover junction endodeoxyribonuclease RuvC [Arachidicoccus sp.]|uniref:crossover junction endodeoxyribonuclease RuvC n=1 Tax=Arachidicoccus sp. TaxID=1872624 RepID=UPI003D1C9A9F
MERKRPVILAIDPGTIKMGFAILTSKGNKLELISMGTLLLASHKDIYVRLEKIHSTVCELIKIHNPTTFAIEAPFFGKNVQSMLKLGRAQGVAIAAAMQFSLSVTEYSPKKVKQSVTGNGNASKEQVWKMLQQTLNIQENPKYFDASDALAVALCHHYQTISILTNNTKVLKDWGDFLSKNPDRIIAKK